MGAGPAGGRFILGSCRGLEFSHPKEVEGCSWHFADSEERLAGRREPNTLRICVIRENVSVICYYNSR